MSEWTIEVEDILAEYALESEILYFIFNKSVSIYHKRVNMFMIPSIIISSITGALLFDERIKSNISISYVLASMNILVAIMQTLLKFLNYNQYETDAKILSIKYLDIYELIKLELQKNPNDRMNSKDFLNNINKKREELNNNYVNIHDAIRKQFKKSHKNLVIPIKLNHISEIKIYGREKPKSLKSINASLNSSIEV